MSKESNMLYRRKLDNSANVFPMLSKKKYGKAFRLSVVLNENINLEKLQIAVNQTLEMFQVFRVKMKRGFFWYYLEYNEKEPIVKEDDSYQCKYINSKSNNDYLFKVTCFKNKINIDIFHALTDGNNGMVFFREIIYKYIELMYPDNLNDEDRKFRKINYDIEDSYGKNYDKTLKPKGFYKEAYILKGDTAKLGQEKITNEIINLDEFKQECKKYKATVTQYMTALLIYAIYKENYIKNKSKSKKPIIVTILVNLKKYFESKTLANFFTFITIEATRKNVDLNSFENIIEFVKQDFQQKLTKEEIKKVMSMNGKFGNIFLVKILPLWLKIIIVRLGYLEIKKYVTITYSNIGRIEIMEKYKNYIKYFFMIIAPKPLIKIRCSTCTFENKMVFTFSSLLKDNSIENFVYKFLQEKKIDVEIECDGGTAEKMLI